ncbi:MAG: NADH-quinone oxidoreductase subunit J [Deltaproteobacteria bacterium]|nr:NADH-quinone oxidoreductase subunit J [Deltaproteobacteria bacterium]
MELVLFVLFSGAALAAAGVVVTRTRPFSAAMALVACLFFLAGDYVILQAPFVAALQILVYAGAILVLFLFVVMLLRLEGDEALPRLGPRQAVGLVLAGIVGCASVAFAAFEVSGPFPETGPLFGTADALAATLLDGRNLLALEGISVLLTTALVGAVVLGRKEL